MQRQDTKSKGKKKKKKKEEEASFYGTHMRLINSREKNLNYNQDLNACP